MLTVLDVAAVEAIIAAKAPRPWREVVLDIYPEATEDRNGRFHAPYDGYECPLTGKLFKGGEYLPMAEPEEDNYRVMSYNAPNHPTAVDADGKVHVWNDLTRAQRLAVWGELFEQTKKADAARSDYLGTVGGKIELEGTVVVLKVYSGRFGNTYFHVIKDDKGNVVFYKGTKKLGGRNQKIRIDAKVKAHNLREGVKQTIIERPKFA